MLQGIIAKAPLYLLVAVRCFAFIMTLPLFSSRTVSRVAKVALAIYFAYLIAPRLSFSAGTFASYATFVTPEGSFNLSFIFLLLGEGMIGIIMGFFISLIFAAFSTAIFCERGLRCLEPGRKSFDGTVSEPCGHAGVHADGMLPDAFFRWTPGEL